MGPDPLSTDIYCEVKPAGQAETSYHRGAPVWFGDDLEVDGVEYRLGQWEQVTVFPSGWDALLQLKAANDG